MNMLKILIIIIIIYLLRPLIKNIFSSRKNNSINKNSNKEIIDVDYEDIE